MKKFTSLLIGCSLALAGAALAQPPEEQPTPKTKRGAEKTHAAEAKPGVNAAKPQETVAKPTGAMKERGATNEPSAGKGRKVQVTEKSATAPGTNVSGQPAASATNEPGAGKGRKGRASQESATATGTNVSGQPAASATPAGGKQQAEQRRRGMKPTGANAKTSPTVTPATANVTSSVAPANQPNRPTSAAGAAKQKPAPQQVQQIKAQHTNFHAQAKPQQVPAVTFNANHRIEGSERWQGPQYEVFRSYHSERHDQGWYRSHYNRVVLIGGGYYYWNMGYWYPAWGYEPSAEYYVFDGPIYVGHRTEPPDQVIADVQAELQQMGYYRGEVDGLLGPLTREALTAYQADQGLTTTAAIDEPTLDSLGLS